MQPNIGEIKVSLSGLHLCVRTSVLRIALVGWSILLEVWVPSRDLACDRADYLAEGEATPRIVGMGYFTICSKSTWGGRISMKRGTRQAVCMQGREGDWPLGGCGQSPVFIHLNSGDSPSGDVHTSREGLICRGFAIHASCHLGFLQVRS